MNFNQGGFMPPENNFNNNQYNFTSYNMPAFVRHDVWKNEKSRIKKLSIISGCAILLFVALSGVYASAFAGLKSIVAMAGGEFATVFNRVIASSEFLFAFEIIYSVFVVGCPFFVLGYIFHKKGIVGTMPMGKPLNSKFLPLVVVAGFGLCLFANIINSWFTAFFEIFTGDGLEYNLTDKIPTDAGGIILFFLSTAVVPALIEEVAMRGIVMQPLRRYGDGFAIICSSLVFGFMHCNLVQIPFALIAGIVIGYAVIITESIWTGVLIHFLTNGFSVAVNIVYEIYGEESIQYEACNVAFVAFMVAGGIAAFFVYKKFGKKPLYKSELINQGRGIYGQVHPWSAKVSVKNFYSAYFLTLPMISAFIVVCYQTVMALSYM